MKRTLNFRFLGLVLTLAAVTALAGHLLHGWQLKRNARYLLEQANQAVSRKDFPKALTYLTHYLTFHPEDGRARAKAGVLLARRAKSHKEFEFAYVTLERALRDSPGLEQSLRGDPELQELRKSSDPDLARIAADEADIHRRLAELAVELQEFTDAKVHLEAALREQPKDTELLVLLGRCEETLGKYDAAAKAYEAAVESHPDHIEGYMRLAYLLRRTEKAKEADKVVERLVTANADSVRARLAAVQYFRAAGQLAAARQNLAAAQSGGLKDDREVLLASADVAIAEKDVAEARAKLARGIELFPREPRFYLVLAELELQTGKRTEAIDLLRKAVAVLPKHSGELWLVADLLIDADERAEARALVTRLREEKADSAAVDFLDARLLLAEGRANKAEVLLRRNQTELARKPDLAVRTQLLMAACYERLGNADLRLKAARQAASLAPTSTTARLAHASALVGAGKPDEAIREYAGAYAAAPHVRFTVVRLQIALGNLKDAEETLDSLPLELKDKADALLTRALILASGPDKDARERARKAVEVARDKYPQEPAFWVFLANTSADPKDGLAILDQAPAEAGSGVAIRLARANLLVRLKADPAALRALEAGAESLPEADRMALSFGLSTAHLRLGSSADAERLLRQADERHPGDLNVLFRLFEVVARKANPAELEALRKKVEEAEGEDGAVWRLIDAYEAWREFVRENRADGLAHARARLAEAGKRRPEWFWVPLLEGEIEDGQGHTDAAIELYRRAVQLGAQQPAVVTRAATLLLARHRVEDAHRLIAELRRHSQTLPQELEQLDAQAAARLGAEPDDLLERLKTAAPESSTDYRDHLLRAGLIAAKKPKEAEAANRKAVDLAPSQPEPWVALVYFLVRENRPADAKAEITKAAAAIAADKRSQALGECYELVGDRAEAEKYLVQAAQGAPADLNVQRALATFYLSGGETAKAEPILRRLVGEPPARRWARRTLALALASGGYSQSTQALALLESNLQEYPNNPEDLRTRSLVRATRPGEREQAIKDLETSFTRIPPAPAEEFLLARLYESDGNWARASERMLALFARRGGEAPAFLAYYVSALLRHKDVGGAERWLARLKEKSKEPTPQVIELQARVDAARGRKAEAARAVKAYARESHAAKPNPNLLRAFATLLAQLELIADADELFQEYVKAAEPMTPLAALVFADFLARYQNRVADALGVCEKALARVDPDLVARQAVAVVRLGTATPDDFDRAERLIQQAVKAKPGSTDIPVSLADLRDTQGRYNEAKDMYREILRASPRNVLAMNNLAWLLALHEGKKEEPLKLLETAVGIQGPDGNLLDTRGVVHLTAGEPSQAVSDLQAAAAQEVRPERYFHLAQAYRKSKNMPEATRTMRKAVNELGLTKKDLHRLEWKAFDELLALIGGQ
jgi:tetratricopeptide (TPR) repeat protein